MKEQNDGFSLVELIVSMAILMIAGAALIGFLSYCMGQYKRTNEEVDLQYASQVFDNRFKNHLKAKMKISSETASALPHSDVSQDTA